MKGLLVQYRCAGVLFSCIKRFLAMSQKLQVNRCMRSKIDINSISFSGMTINVSQTCRNLGVMLDCNMTMSNQISSICRSVRYQLRNIGFIRKYLNRSSTEKLVHALISSRLDFGNSILFNLPQTQLSILQRLQNAAARIITLSKKHTHITPILKSLHWLQVRDRIIFKILLLTFHCVQGTAPQYNIDLVHNYTPVRSLRSSNSGSLVIPKFATTWGTRAFAHAGPTLWNNLPSVIKNCSSSDSFKSGLKTHLFNDSFWITHAFVFCTFLLLNNLLFYLRLEHSTEWIWRIINHINYLTILQQIWTNLPLQGWHM